MAPPAIDSPLHSSSQLMRSADFNDRHEFGVQKNRKTASTGGGRAWSEDEEVYLLQTRLQKMPYKHIAAHLKKTELACRLHYHQLSHGSNRRRGNTSVSSDSTFHSPDMHASRTPSPIQGTSWHPSSKPCSPASNTHSQEFQPVHLPSAVSLLSRTGASSPRRPGAHSIAILPKPAGPRHCTSNMPPLRLDCGAAQPASFSHPLTNNSSNVPIDHGRLAHIYNSHRAAFWSAIAVEYGHSITAQQLEDAWLRSHSASTFTTTAPPTPCGSPDGNCTTVSMRSLCRKEIEDRGRVKEKEGRANATSISALLGIDASPKSQKERELIKQIEERRDSVGEMRIGSSLLPI